MNELFESAPDGKWVAPGRVNIIGEHTDYNNGYVLPIALPHLVTCLAARRSDGVVQVASRQRDRRWTTVPIDELASSDLVGWARYPLGVVHEYVRRGHAVTGVDLYLDGAVPVGAGLSSSAAVECSVAIAVRDLFELGVTDDEVIDIARVAENDYVGAPTGILDQSASILCTAGHALLLDVATGERAQVPFDLRASGLELLVIDTNTPHALVDGEYAQRRRECEEAAAALGVESLRDVPNVDALAAIADRTLRHRARHVVTENARVLTVVSMLRSGADPREIGPILTDGHDSLRDDFEVSAKQLDAAVETALDAGAHGARMVGGGFGGSVIVLAERSDAEQIAAAVGMRFAGAGFVPPRTFLATPSAGAHRVC